MKFSYDVCGMYLLRYPAPTEDELPEQYAFRMLNENTLADYIASISPTSKTYRANYLRAQRYFTRVAQHIRDQRKGDTNEEFGAEFHALVSL